VKTQNRDQIVSARPDGGEGGEPSAQSELLGSPAAKVGEPVPAARFRKDKTSTPRWPPPYPGSADALSLLTLHPVFATPLPRHHVAPRAPDGKLVVEDRATGERFVVYSPRFACQFRAGHHAGQWYLRPAADAGTAPRSVGFPAPRAAVEALRADDWRLRHVRRNRAPKDAHCRVIWA
jgi:hypothetical protein